MGVISLISVDGTKKPNLALEKLATYYVGLGYAAIWDLPLVNSSADKVFVSCVFDWNRDKAVEIAEMYPNKTQIGGSGYDISVKLPGFKERLSCLQYAAKAGYSTSVSCEPFLDSHTVYLYQACLAYISDSFWIGKLRHFKQRVDLAKINPEDMEKYVKPLLNLQEDWYIKSLFKTMNGLALVEWKDSITEVIERCGMQTS